MRALEATEVGSQLFECFIEFAQGDLPDIVQAMRKGPSSLAQIYFASCRITRNHTSPGAGG
jgi:hypothetical protein